MRVDGRAIAAQIYAELSEFYKGRETRLGIVVVGNNPVIESFVRTKSRAAERLGIEVVREDLPGSSTMQDIRAATETLVVSCDAVIMQLPLPAEIDIEQALAYVPNEKDVDALNPRVSEDKRLVHAPVALAVVEILKHANVEIKGARVVVVGAGRLVGKPTAWMLQTLGANVSFFTLKEGSIDDLKTADILVSGAGKPGLIQPEHLKKGVALIDAGTSEKGAKVVGDADPSCAEVADIFTPVPGGVGPVAVAMIFRNLKALIEKQ